MVSHIRSFAPAFEEVKVAQITESRISNVVAMLPVSLQSGPIRFLRRSISLHTLRPGVVVPASQSKPRPLSEADAAALNAEPLETGILTQRDEPQYTEAEAARPHGMSRVLYSETKDDEQVVRAASGIHWKFARQGTLALVV